MEKRMCELYDRECIDCGECEFCDLDPTKICNNCGKCIEMNDYAAFKIDSVDGVELHSAPNRSQSRLKGRFKASKKFK